MGFPKAPVGAAASSIYGSPGIFLQAGSRPLRPTYPPFTSKRQNHESQRPVSRNRENPSGSQISRSGGGADALGESRRAPPPVPPVGEGGADGWAVGAVDGSAVGGGRCCRHRSSTTQGRGRRRGRLGRWSRGRLCGRRRQMLPSPFLDDS